MGVNLESILGGLLLGRVLCFPGVLVWAPSGSLGFGAAGLVRSFFVCSGCASSSCSAWRLGRLCPRPLLAILVFLYRLMMHFMRKRSLSKLLEKQAATCGRKRRVSFQYWLNPRDEEFHKNDLEEATAYLSISPPCQHSRQNKADTRTGVHQVPSEAKTRQESV